MESSDQITTSPQEAPAANIRDERPVPHKPPRRTPFWCRLGSAAQRSPVTVILSALNLAVFATMACLHRRVAEFNTHILMSWGADYAPRTFHGDWWRLVSSMFLHGGLAHMSVNLLFLLLIAPRVERWLGSLRFAVAYGFAGLGGELLALGWFPAHGAVGASAAVYGVYGIFLGCCLRRPRSLSSNLCGRQTGLLVLFACVNLLLAYLERDSTLIPHLGGMLFGMVAGLLFGRGPRTGSAWRRLIGFVLATSACAALLAVTGWGMQHCAGQTVQLLTRYEAARQRERDLLAQFTDSLAKWEDGDLSDAGLGELLQAQLIPAWDRMRGELALTLPNELAPLESQPLSMRDLLRAGDKKDPAQPGTRPHLSEKEYDTLYRVYLKLRLDNWRALAKEIQDKHSDAGEAVLDLVWIELLRRHLDELAEEEGNPLREWLDFSRGRAREKKRLLTEGEKK
jgi:rhomboid protease GluP